MKVFFFKNGNDRLKNTEKKTKIVRSIFTTVVGNNINTIKTTFDFNFDSYLTLLNCITNTHSNGNTEK